MRAHIYVCMHVIKFMFWQQFGLIDCLRAVGCAVFFCSTRVCSFYPLFKRMHKHARLSSSSQHDKQVKVEANVQCLSRPCFACLSFASFFFCLCMYSAVKE